MLHYHTLGAGAMKAACYKEGDRLSLNQNAGQDTNAAADQTPASARGGATSDKAGLLALILKVLDDMKAEEVVQIDLTGKTSLTDAMVICSGRSSRQVAAIADRLAEDVKRDLGILCKSEGKETGDWVLIDAGDVIVHIFRPEVREFYQLEKMWQPMAAGA